MSAIELELSKLRLDGGTQSRAAFDWVTVADYAESMKEGAQFPAIVVFFDGTEHWVADGFHRVEARRAAGLPSILSDVRQGTVREAVLFSVGANTDHGLRRTQADKRRSVMRLFDDDEWRQWADREIARRCGVSHVFVSKLRQEVFGCSQEDMFSKRKYVRNGQEHSMNTRNIGAGADDSPASAQLGFDSVPGFQSDQVQAESPAQTGATGNVTSSPFWFDTPAGWREGWGPIVDTTGVGTWFSSKHVSLPLRISNYRNLWLFAIDGSEEFSSSRFSIPSNFEAEGFLHPGDAAQAAENAWSDLQHIARFQTQAKHGEPAQAGAGATGNVTSEENPVDYSRPAGENQSRTEESRALDSSEGEYQDPEIERPRLFNLVSELEEQNAELRQYAEQINITLRTNDELLTEYQAQIKELNAQCARQSAQIERFRARFKSWSELIQGKETQPRWVNVAKLLKEFEQLLVAE